MDYKVILSPLALADLEQIVRYVAAHDAAAAQRLGTRLLDQAETLCRLPHRGGRVRARPVVMKLLFRPYLIFYPKNGAGSNHGLHRLHGFRDFGMSAGFPPSHPMGAEDFRSKCFEIRVIREIRGSYFRI